MARRGWFVNKKKLLQEEQEREAVAMAEAKRELALKRLRERLEQALETDARFQVTTVDNLYWICPYTGRMLNIAFDAKQAILAYLIKKKPFNGNAKPLMLNNLYRIAWKHFLRENLAQDDRYAHFADGQWLNPITGAWVADIPLGKQEEILPETIRRMAESLAQHPPDQAEQCMAERVLKQLVRDRMAVPDGSGRIKPGADLDDEEVEINADSEFQLQALAAGVNDQTSKAVESEPAPTDSKRNGRQDSQEIDTDTIRHAYSDPDGQRARSVQSKMLPKIPQLAAFKLGIHFRPHDAVSGDFYDLQTLSDGRLLVALGDVSGHGVQAGLVVHSTLKSLRFICKTCTDLTEIVCTLNEELLEDLLHDQFVTAWFAIIDPRDYSAECVWCGHHPMAAARPANNAYLNIVGQKGPVLGMLKPALFSRAVSPLHLDLQPGDLLLQYTDGATEAMDAVEEEFGEHRLYGQFVTLLLDEQGLDAQGLADGLAEQVLTWAGQSIADDLTVMVIEVNDPATNESSDSISEFQPPPPE